ncbi:hypothetical protein [Candidatus Coxiella mudrowiae]|nr:hypothetical protein [Candidatus Coxiella mudrowiae]
MDGYDTFVELLSEAELKQRHNTVKEILAVMEGVDNYIMHRNFLEEF